MLPELIEQFAFPAAKNEQIGREEQLKMLKILTESVRPFLSAYLQSRTRSG
jgi:hypothetical protein